MLSHKQHKRYHRRAILGFTLIEVLVAIAVFASLSLGAYQVVNQAQRGNQISKVSIERIKQLQRSLIFLDNDFRQMAPRQFRTDGEEASKKLLYAGDYVGESQSQGILFVRLGWQNPQQTFPRGEITKVGYRLIDGTLERVWWRYPDTVSGDQPITVKLLDKVSDLHFFFYDGKSWLESWDKELMLPAAVKLSMRLEDKGLIERIFLTTAVDLQQLNSGSDSSGKDDVTGGNGS
ncbi:MAG: type II secretion system minor pseudopilin GspJ [Aliivibrio sp.]|uniref:type II secretion system minor pseudopilin GspJ n=1 Tax=Aliivibrio sp. TaxID=1872443 RepID=UPI001A36BB77|nr:type II secretion system minor pseudopilin GspJ [Aliivibrio sp.]